MKTKAKLVLVFAVLLALMPVTLGLNASKVSASSSILFDTFFTLPLKPSPSAQFWIINSGVDENGFPARVEDYCGSASCVQQKWSGGESVVELSQSPNQLEGYYYNAELSELQTGFAYGQTTQWNPDPLRPVVLSARVKFSGNYNIDGTGGAVGSAGVWLWNSPVDLMNEQFHEVNALGFQWVNSNSVLIPGLAGGSYVNNFPEWQVPVTNVNMQNWNNFTLIWSESFSGKQTVSLLVNGNYIGSQALSTPLSNLSLEVWNDNQRATFEGVTYDPATEEQFMQVDYVSLLKI